MRLFVGVSIPRSAHKVLAGALERFAPVIKTRIPRERWHMTLVFLGEVAASDAITEKLGAEISLPYMPTASITHVGRGKQKDQLWAYLQPTPVLNALQKTLVERLGASRTEKHFTPHIKLANLQTTKSPFDLPDAAAVTTFPIREVAVFQSIPEETGVRYEKMTSIAVTA